jgi:hypothetical protein
MSKQMDQTDEPEEWDEAGFEAPPWLEFERGHADPEQAETETTDPQQTQTAGEGTDDRFDAGDTRSTDEPREPFPAGHPVQFAEDLRSVYDLETAVNGYKQTIYVQEWDEYTGKPKVWYEFDRAKILIKRVRSTTGITVTYLGKTKYID